MAQSPTSRSLSYCRERAWLVDVAEKTIPHSHRKRDLFGFIDIVVIADDTLLAVQVTSSSNHSARVKKIKNECYVAADAWNRAGGQVEVWSWRKTKKRNADGRWWKLRREKVTL